jgi:signal peptidase II
MGTVMTFRPAFLYGGLWLGLDMATKDWAQRILQGRDILVVPGFFQLSLVHNSGIAFGLFDEPGAGATPVKSLLLVCVALAALAIVSRYALRTPPGAHWTQLALGLLLGGITGNMADRLIHSYVVDFLEFDLYFFKFPTFNVADSGITIGVILLFLISLRHPDMFTDSPAVRPVRAATAGSGGHTEVGRSDNPND